jgi:hypothetical protein
MSDSPKEEVTPGFAPDEPDDGRGVGNWQTRYPDPIAQSAIESETKYLLIHFAICPILLAFLHSGFLEHCTWLNIESHRISSFTLLATSWICGLFGGTLFSLKWLYHSVAKEIWNIDRKLWRLLTPYLSAGVAFVIWIVITSGLFGVFDSDKLRDVNLTMAMGFISGYFSDSAVAKLSEIAQGVFGTTTNRK